MRHYPHCKLCSSFVFLQKHKNTMPSDTSNLKSPVVALTKDKTSQTPALRPEPDPSSRPHSAFSSLQKKWITYAISTCAMFSGLSSFIYYPAISSLSTSLNTPISLINLTITSYLIVAGLAPSITGDLADTTGRRPIYLLTIGVYVLANVGLAVQRSYVALLVLRMVQSFGSSGE